VYTGSECIADKGFTGKCLTSAVRGAVAGNAVGVLNNTTCAYESGLSGDNSDDFFVQFYLNSAFKKASWRLVRMLQIIFKILVNLFLSIIFIAPFTMVCSICFKNIHAFLNRLMSKNHVSDLIINLVNNILNLTHAVDWSGCCACSWWSGCNYTKWRHVQLTRHLYFIAR